MSGTKLNDDGLKIEAQDLSLLSPTNEDDNRLFNHDGSSAITLAGGTTTSNAGYYMWDNTAGTWKPMKENVEQVGGYTASEIAMLAENESVSGLWNFGQNPTVNGNPVFHGGNKIDTTDLSFDPAEQVELDAHVSRSNPHNTTASDVGAAPASHATDTSNPHSVTAAQVGALENPISSAVNMNGNYLDNRKGVFFGYGASHGGMDGGVHANVANSVVVSNGYSRNSSSSVQVNRSGLYKINYSINFHQTGGGARAVMAARVEVNGSAKSGQSESRCYIRNTADGDMNHVTAECVLNLNSGDDIQVYAWRHHGVTGHDITHGRISMEYLG
ncbi:hypothetical protein HCTV-6_gp31 [Haloarcula virus HCTV-6]|nr:hypothetical protein HCTV-6_gp31 [Haloarcula virus HCTV-6]